ncbi:MAG TPA: BTAD domain-containing putative transcriptional regulator, partial [Catenuloplanes sp.]
HTVQRGDSLSEIAEQWLGDANRWPEIFALNRGTHFADTGGTLTNPHLIYPGWTLDLPDDATPPGGHHTEPPQPEGENPAEPAPGGTATPAPSATTTPTSPAPATPGSPAPTTPAPASTAPPRHDGVIGPVPTGPATSTPSSGPSSATATASPAASSPSADRGGPRGVSLLSGSWVDLGLAAAIAAAVALVWAHRRRRYTHRPPSLNPRLDDPDLAPMPSVVAQVRRGLRRPAPEPPAALDDAQEPGVDDLFDDDEAGQQPAGADRVTAVDDDGEVADPAGPPGVAPAPVVPALANPLSAVWPPAGLGLTGPGAEAAARGFLTAGLAAGGLDDPDARTWVVMPSATAATLLGTAAVTLPNTPRLTVTGGLDEALELLEAQTLHRTRLVYRHEVDDVTALRHADPLEEPLPPILLIADAATRHERTRITALLSQGQRLDIHGVLLGAWPDGNTVVVAADGATTAADGDAARHGSHPADVGRLTILDPTETADLLRTLAESHTGQPQAPAPAETTQPTPTTTETAPPGSERPPRPLVADEPASPTGTANSETTLASDTRPAADTVEPAPDAGQDAPAPAPSPVPVGAAGAPADGQVPASGLEHLDADADADADTGAAAEEAEPAPGHVEVTVLGDAEIVNADPERKPREKAREVLVYLAVHDGSAAAEAILDDLLPDALANTAPHRLHTYVSNLRSVLRHNGGPGTYITHLKKHYALNRGTIDVDLWRMRAALKDADIALTPQERAAALRRAVDTYAGPLADGYDYEWIESYREGVRRQAYDACLALVAALSDQPDEQLAVLTAAIGHHPYAEELYQAAMRAQSHLGHLDAIRGLRRTLTRRLAEIDAEPSDDTIALADQLVAQLQRPGRAARLRPALDSGDGAAA